MNGMMIFAGIFIALAFGCLMLDVWISSMGEPSEELRRTQNINRVNGWVAITLAAIALLVM